MWLPLHVHLTDSGAIAGLIWAEWLGSGVRAVIARDAGSDEDRAGKIVRLAAALHDIGKLTPAFAGQVPEMCTEMERHGFHWSESSVPEDSRALPHAVAGYVLLMRYLEIRGVPRRHAEAFAAIVGGHHGVPPNRSQITDAISADSLLGAEEWEQARMALLDHVLAELDLYAAVDALHSVCLSDASQLLITAVVIMADWIASNSELFPLIPQFTDVTERSVDRAMRAWRTLDLPPPWQPTDEALTRDPTELLRSRFGVPYEANEVQHLAVDAARSMTGPGLLLIEAVMGAGKTEAALLAAEVMARRFGRSGVFFGLPTRATADASFHRLLPWWQNLPDAEYAAPIRGVVLRHSAAPLNDEYRELPRRRIHRPAGHGPLAIGRMQDVARDEEVAAWGFLVFAAELIAHYWTSGRKQASFADTVVATIDHHLLAALASRHVVLRHLGLARQIVILDEVHAADTWMEVYLERALEWLARYGVPVIVLSATLPPDRRRALVAAYEQGRRAADTITPLARKPPSPGLLPSRRPRVLPPPEVPDSDRYPLVTTFADGKVRQVSADAPAGYDIHLDWLADDDDSLIAALDPVVSAGGCALVICNTVTRAVRKYRRLREVWGEDVALAHSRFIARDRMTKDTWLRDTFGPGEHTERAGRVVIATQVAEQSLDIDFDLLVTDLAPIDLVLQRIGRLHRHPRNTRPGPGSVARCLVTGMARLPSEEVPPELDRGGASIYSRHLLLRSAALMRDYIREARPLRLPDDVPALVRICYGGGIVGPTCWGEDMAEAQLEFDTATAEVAKQATTYRLRAPGESRLVVGLLDANVGEAESTVGMSQQVRQSDGGFEVILLEQADDGLRLLPSFDDGRRIPTDTRPDPSTARLLARSIVRVPGWVTRNPSDTDGILRELAERYYPAWQKDPVIAGQLVLTLDAEGTGSMGPFTVYYDDEIGLEVARG